MSKTTKKEFDRFVKTCLHWQQKLQLIEWRLDINHRRIRPDTAAETEYFPEDRVVSITYNLNPGGGGLRPEQHAKHEMLEVLLCQLDAVANARYINPSEVNEARHAIIRRLEAIL